MRNKRKISISLISFILLFLGVFLYLSYYFYNISKVTLFTTKIKSTDYYQIDSLKKSAVIDTSIYYDKEISRLKREINNKDRLLIEKDSENIKLKDFYDSLNNKFYLYKN